MRNFHLLAQNCDVGPLLARVMRYRDLWNADRLRTSIPSGPHAEADDIILRFGKPDINDIGPSEDRPAMRLLEAKGIALNVMQLVGGSELGRVLITRLPPGGRIGLHADEGAYSERMTRHQMMLQCYPGNTFACGDETLSSATGDLFWFDHHIEHEVINNSAHDRIALIIDCRID